MKRVWTARMAASASLRDWVVVVGSVVVVVPAVVGLVGASVIGSWVVEVDPA